MAKYLVQQTFYLSTVIEANSWMEAKEKAEDTDWATWDFNDCETPTVVDVTDEM